MANLRTNNLSGEQGQNAYRGSVQFLGGNDALVIPASSDFAYGTGDFTIEAWIWKAGIPAAGESRGIFTQTQSGNNYVVFVACIFLCSYCRAESTRARTMEKYSRTCKN